MINKSIIQKLSDKEMDRKDFLKYSGAILIGVVGLKGLTSLIAQIDQPTPTVAKIEQSRGFGSGRYGA